MAARDPDAIKLFVGQLPKLSSETDLAPFFEQYGPIAEFSILRDKAGVSKGCAFLTFTSRQAGVMCMEALHDKHTFPGMTHALQVKPADSEIKAEDRKLFVGMVPKIFTEDQLRSLFLPYGGVEEVAFIQKNGVFQGCAFVKMDTRANAQRAVDMLNGSTTLEGCRAPIVVKYADTDREKQHKRAYQGFPTPFGNMMNPMMMSMFQQMATQAGGRPPVAHTSSMGVPNMQAGGFGQQPYQQAGLGNALRPPRFAANTDAGGPDGANLFIYHIPPELNDSALAALFLPFGSVISAKVFVDKATGLSKGFGFVSYDNPVSAQAAITSMNGFQMGAKRLKVELKKSRGAPY